MLTSGALDLSMLNRAQKAAATHIEGPAVVYAGAGSGKTRVICTRIAYLMENGVSPYSILAVTFTNKAAKEMKERVEHLVGAVAAKNLIISTFHSFCARFLRIYAKEIGYQDAFSIYDDGDQKDLLKDILNNLNVSEKILSVNVVKSKIDRLKNMGITPDEYARQIKEEDSFPALDKARQFRSYGENYQNEVVHSVYSTYQKMLKKRNAMDFNDLLLVMYELMTTKPDILERLQNRFQYFLIDEFQDTNPIQFKLISLLSSKTRNLFIVGDDDQSIYSWRGAEPSFIMNFHTTYEGSTVFKLEENYRSTGSIIAAANNVIKNNLKRAPKTLHTTKEYGEKIKLKAFEDPYAEARFIADEILKTYQTKKRFSDFCILYRTNAQSRALEDELRRRMLPYVIYGSVRFYERAEIKLLLSYLKLLINGNDDASFQKVINTPRRGFGDKALDGLKNSAQEKNISLLEAAVKIAFGEFSADIGRGLSGIKSFTNHYLSWKNALKDGEKPSTLLKKITSDINFEEYLRQGYPEDFDERWLNIIELKNAITDFEQKDNENVQSSTEILSLFIEQAMLTIEPTVVNVKEGQQEAITLMTIHSAKGLEFRQVFLTGLEEGILPHQNSLENPEAVEEERRLMYVAITRAQEKLILTRCKRSRYRDFMPAVESRFLDELPGEYIDQEIKKPNVSSFVQKQMTEMAIENAAQDAPWRKGQRVSHKIFGEGIIRDIEKGMNVFRLKIQFERMGIGEKTLVDTFVTPL